MSHFSYTRAAGIWNANLAVLHTEFQSLDQKTFAAVNGDGGGTWAPSSVIEIGGSGLLVSGPFEASGDATFANVQVTGDANLFNASVSGDANVTGDLGVGGFATFIGSMSIGDNSADALTINATPTFNALAAFGAGVNITSGGIACAGGLSVSSGTTSVQALNIATNLGGTPTLAVKMATTGAGRVVPRVFSMTNANSTTRGPANYDQVIVPASVLTADRDFQIDDTGAVDGDQMHFANFHEATYFLVVKRPGGTTLLSIRNLASYQVCCTATRVAGTWEVFAVGDAP